MGFCTFSKDFASNAYTNVENKFIVKYMPEAEDFAVKVYLYGLFLCQNPTRDFPLENCAEVLKMPKERIIDAFTFWEACDLIQIIAKEPFTIEYLPISSTTGKPKRIRYETYTDFNKELQRKMSSVGVFLDYAALQKYMTFLQSNDMEQQALLLIVEYCIQRSGRNVSHAEIFNKAKNFIKRGLMTSSQVEKALSDFNVHTADLIRVMNALGGFKGDPNENDYALFSKWMGDGFEVNAIISVAKSLKRGNMQTLDVLLAELREKGVFTADSAVQYLTERDRLCALTFKIAKNLGLKISSPLVYNEQYTAKWVDWGFEEEGNLCALALLCTKTERNTFSQLDELITSLHEQAYTDENVEEYLKEQQKDLKLLSKIQNYCGTIRKSQANLNMLAVWRKWEFSDDMIIEAAKRAENTAHPLSYINKILSAWKRDGIFKVGDIPERKLEVSTQKPAFVNPTVTAQDERADRERYYSILRTKAQTVADETNRRALLNPDYKKLVALLTETERKLAKAEAFGDSNALTLQLKVQTLQSTKKHLLADMGITEDDLLPKYSCKKCQDTGFLPDGRACDCYKK